MQIPKKQLNNLIRELKKIKLLPGVFQVDLEEVNVGDDTICEPEAVEFEATSISSLSKIWQTLQKPFKTQEIPSYLAEYLGEKSEHHVHIVNGSAINFHTHPTVKFVPGNLPNMNEEREVTYYPRVMEEAPFEQSVDGVTYRLVTNFVHRYNDDSVKVYYCVPHTDPCYDYLDRHNIFKQYEYRRKNGIIDRRHVIAPELSYDTLMVFILCSFSPRFPEMLQDGCYCHPDDAQAYRIRMEKALPKDKRATYEAVKTVVDAEYQKCTTLILLDKLNKGEAEFVEVNDIRFGKGFAKYLTLEIKADNFIEMVKEGGFDLTRQYDIYQLIQGYCDGVVETLESQIEQDKTVDRVIPTFTVNEIPITLTYTAKNHHRCINGIHINSAELEEVLYRATCHNPENYGIFLKKCSRMSLSWTDALNNGLGVKIHKNITREEYENEVAAPNAPRIDFTLIDGRIHMYLSETDQTLRVKLGKLINAVKRINRLTNNKHNRSGWTHRNHSWAREQLQDALIRCTTFEHTPLTPIQVITAIDPTEYKEEQLRIAAQEAIAKAEAERIKQQAELARRTLQERQIKRAETLQLFKKMEEDREKAIKKSEQFLAMAVKHTKATTAHHADGDAWLVKGKLRSYYIIKHTGKVYEAKTGNYVCIVNDSNYKGMGLDCIVSRLYALRNDSMVENMITTLKNLQVDEPDPDLPATQEINAVTIVQENYIAPDESPVTEGVEEGAFA
jgi:hypothetical protein